MSFGLTSAADEARRVPEERRDRIPLRPPQLSPLRASSKADCNLDSFVWISGLGSANVTVLSLRFLLGLPLARDYAVLVGSRWTRRPHLPGRFFATIPLASTDALFAFSLLLRTSYFFGYDL